ncbi:MAG: hypothetical protein RR061_08170 [Muribaculaceae bacterium]
MGTNLHSMMLMRGSLPPHSYHPNASLMLSGRRNCYVASPINRAKQLVKE